MPSIYGCSTHVCTEEKKCTITKGVRIVNCQPVATRSQDGRFFVFANHRLQYDFRCDFGTECPVKEEKRRKHPKRLTRVSIREWLYERLRTQEQSPLGQIVFGSFFFFVCTTSPARDLFIIAITCLNKQQWRKVDVEYTVYVYHLISVCK